MKWLQVTAVDSIVSIYNKLYSLLISVYIRWSVNSVKNDVALEFCSVITLCDGA